MVAKKTIIIGAILIPMLVVACMKSLGGLAIDQNVAQAFRAGQVDPGLRYYYAGRENIPYAIIGIDRDYTVPSAYWIRMDPDSDQLKEMSQNIFQEIRTNPYGAKIVGPDGKTIGIWYSNIYNYTIRVDSQARTIQILFVNPENEGQPGR